MTDAPPDQPSYEEAREELIEVVRTLEAGGTTLEESLALWERGEALAKVCQEWLDGARKRLVNAAMHPLRTSSSIHAGSVLMIEDITSRVQLEEQLQISEKMASIGLLAAGVAHEVNTPLTGISSFTQMLLEQADPEDPRTRLLEKIEPDLRALLGVRGPPVFRRHTFWPRAIPQYDLGYERHLATIAEVERAQRGLFFGGQVRDGISLPACIAAGERLARQVN